MAYVGLNEQNGTVLLFNLIIPKTPNGKDLAMKLWETFINETTELPEPLLLKATGQEMHLGYTIVDVVERKIRVIAEKRKSDQKVRFAAIPEDQTVEFKFKRAFTTLMELDWHHDEPLLKIEGTYFVDKTWVQYSMTTSVFIKEVNEFTPVPALKKNVFIKEL